MKKHFSIPRPSTAAIGAASAAPQHSKRDQAIAEARRRIVARDMVGAYRLIEPYLGRRSRDAEALYLAGYLAESARDAAAAIRYAERSLALNDHPETLLLLARCRRMQGETATVVKLCNRVLARVPGHLHACTVKAGALEEAGRIDEAEAVLAPLVDEPVDRGPVGNAAVGTEWAKVLVQRKRHAEAVSVIDGLLPHLRAKDADALDVQNRQMLLYLKAKACDRQGDYAGAMEAAQEANALAVVEYSPQVYEDQIDALLENWSAEAMPRFPLSRCDSVVPVFVAGMPRSGTSLIDQIIDTHPQAAGVGELSSIEQFAMRLSQAWNPDLPAPECFGDFQEPRWTRAANDYVKEIRRLAPPRVERVVNKALGNNRLVGLIARLFPKTRIIHALRDPRDVAISCFMGGFNQRTFAWTHRFEDVVHAWGQSRRVMSHWQQTLDIPILEVRYERLVTDPETEFPRIIEFLGLEWDEACRRFHESRRVMRTLSYDQVNRPLYTTSVGRYRHYAKWLEGIELPDYAE